MSAACRHRLVPVVGSHATNTVLCCCHAGDLSPTYYGSTSPYYPAAAVCWHGCCWCVAAASPLPVAPTEGSNTQAGSMYSYLRWSQNLRASKPSVARCTPNTRICNTCTHTASQPHTGKQHQALLSAAKNMACHMACRSTKPSMQCSM